MLQSARRLQPFMLCIACAHMLPLQVQPFLLHSVKGYQEQSDPALRGLSWCFLHSAGAEKNLSCMMPAGAAPLAAV